MSGPERATPDPLIRPSRVAALLFGSGLCALVYQIAWLREFRLVFGASTAASAAVLAIFIGGLGLGGLLLGPRADRHPRPLRWYALLELGIALGAAVTPFLLDLVRSLYVALGGTPALGVAGGTILRLVLAALVLAVPTTLMGGTLPAAGRAVEGDEDVGRRRLGVLYGLNTLGAVGGCLLATFVLLESLGTRRTLWLACALNLAVAGLARWTAVRAARRGPRDGATPEGETGLSATPDAPRAPGGFVLAAAAAVGFSFFLAEIVWYRMLGPLLGGTVFTFGLILAVALLGIGLGGAAYAVARKDRPATLSGFAHTCLLEAVFLVVPYALGDRLAVLALLLRPLGGAGLAGELVGWSIVTSIVVLPASIAAGVQFPMLVALLGRGRHRVGREVGLAYASNTAGAIAGSLAGGFGILPLLGATGAWLLAAWLLLGIGLAAIVLSARIERRRRALFLPSVLAAAVLLLSLATGPTAAWRHSPIGAGRVPIGSVSSANDIAGFLNQQRRVIAWEAEGVESSVAIDQQQAISFVINGKVDGNARLDAPTQVMGGLVGALFHPAPRRALVIGLGTGSTAGWFGTIPEMEAVDVIELEPAILEVARRCAPVNRDVLENPRVRVSIGDAREWLLAGRTRYDLIFSEPSNPYRAGIASLFTREFYAAVAARLSEGGIFLQWVQAYDIDGRTLRSIYATLGTAFAHVETWRVQANDLVLLASAAPPARDAASLRERVRAEPYRSALAATWRVTDLEGALSRFIAGPVVSRRAAQAQPDAVNTDDRNQVEFGFAHTVGRPGSVAPGEIASLARLLGDHRPEIAGEVDWGLVDRLAVGAGASEGSAPAMDLWFGQLERALAEAFAFWVNGELAAALGAWRGLGLEPASLTELALAAETAAFAGEESAALPPIERLRAFQPIEAGFFLAALRARQGRLDDAEALLAGAFEALREDPWPHPLLVRRMLDLARSLAAREPRRGERLFALLETPFAVRLLEDRRLDARLAIADAVDFGRFCVEAIDPYEPDVPWTLEFLVKRAACYRMRGGALEARAKRDLDRYLGSYSLPFSAGLVPQ